MQSRPRGERGPANAVFEFAGRVLAMAVAKAWTSEEDEIT